MPIPGSESRSIPATSDHELLLALNEQVYEVRKEIRSLHRLMTAMKKAAQHTGPPVNAQGTVGGTEVSMTMSEASYHDPLFDLDMDQIGA